MNAFRRFRQIARHLLVLAAYRVHYAECAQLWRLLDFELWCGGGPRLDWRDLMFSEMRFSPIPTRPANPNPFETVILPLSDPRGSIEIIRRAEAC